MPRALFWHVVLALPIAAAIGCSPLNVKEGGDADAGSGSDGGLGSDGGPRALVWPSAEATYPGAIAPSMATTKSGKVVLVLANEAKLWSVTNPGTGAALAELYAGVATESGSTRLVADPDSEKLWLYWFQGKLLGLDAGAPIGSPQYVTTASLVYSAFQIGLSWSGGRPVGTLLSSENNRYRSFAFDVGTGDFSPLGAPPTEAVLKDASPQTWFYEMSLTAVGLDAGKALVFFNDANGSGPSVPASWIVLKRDPAAALTGPAWLVPDRSGTFDVPVGGNTFATWIQIHSLGPGLAALTWATNAPGTMVYDVFLALLLIASDGTPSVASQAVNVSGTGGMTDNSDFPVVLPSGDGRIWVAWREANLGPRVALYSGSLTRQGIAAPSVELHNDNVQAIAAAVDGSGTLHLAGVVRPVDTVEVRCWAFPRL